jgi:hypothetical protein
MAGGSASASAAFAVVFVVAFVVAAVGMSWRAAPAFAHQQSATFGEVTGQAEGPSGFAVSWRLRVGALDLMSALARSAPDAFAATAPDGQRLAIAYLGAGLHVFSGAAGVSACAPGTSSLSRDEGAVEMTLIFEQRFTCRHAAETVRLRYDLFFEIDPAHESFNRLALAGAAAGAGAGASASAAGAGSAAGDRASETAVFRRDHREVTVVIGRPNPMWKSAFLYLRLGVEHILTGYDHLAFLAALLLAAGLRQRTGPTTVAAPATPRQSVRGTVTIISAFTVAHSLTLISQVLRPGWLSTRWVEPAIAFSVAYVGVENLIAARPRRRWLLVFGFGLVHGLGFASVLREIGLPRRGLLLCLISFNAGVELGQLVALGVALPIIVAAARRAPRSFERWGLQLGSALIAGFGVIWLVARLLARRT